jgi:type VI secretion system protein ImpL
MYWVVTGIVLLIYLVLVWFLGTWLPLRGNDVWILRIGLAVLGVIAAGVTVWFLHKKKVSESEAEETGEGASESNDLDLLVREAIRRLKKSTLGRGVNLGSLPLVFVLGDSGSTKTTTIIHSALDPELLAGQVYRDNEVLPTDAANIWYTRQAIFVDPAGSVMSQADRWKRLVRLVQPGRFSSAIGKRSQAPRAALVCYDCETFLRAGASETTVSAARRLAVRLQEVSQLLGISFPVYVLFTKLDRISFFPEFVRGMGKDEAAEVLGATLPLRSPGTGVYAEEETRRLTKALDEIFYSLAERRLVLLPREHEKEKLPGIYEFPRELKKLRTLLVQFLVDLARPSHLSSNPFLRGFYFTGVRPVVVEDVVAATPLPEQDSEPAFDAGATRIFSGVRAQPSQAPAANRAAGSRRVPQWAFLSGLFNDVMVKDRVALAASGSSSRVNLLRRLALAVAVFIGVVCLLGFGISFLRNHALETDVRDAIEGLRTIQTGPNQVANLGDLQRLDHLRQELALLSSYQSDGAPLSMRWGLYVGDQIYTDARRVYFQRFWQLLFADTQSRLLEGLRAVPDTPGPNDVYDATYSELKAYLITTSDHDKSTKEFLTPVLMSHWKAGRDIDSDRAALATSQFDFYSTELATDNPFSSSNFPTTIGRARVYLQNFAGVERYYSLLLAKASQNNHDISFNDQFADTAGVIASSHRVKGAFTRGGFSAASDALKKPSTYLTGEEWVLGKNAAPDFDPSKLQQELTQRYYQDFVNEWHTVLETSSVVRYQNFKDADKKLEKMTSPTSPLLELFWFISNNTAVGVPDVSDPFLPFQAIEPPGEPGKLPSAFILPPNKEYVGALAKLQSDVAALAQSINPNDPAAANPTITSAAAAEVAATTAVGTGVDQKFHHQDILSRLLKEPITSVEDLLKKGPADAANAGGASFCSQFNGISMKYPLRPDSPVDLSIDELNAIFAPPKGVLWTFYDSSLNKLLIKNGSRYVAIDTGTVKLSPVFVDFFNRAAQLSDALYPSGSAPPHFSYSLRQMPSNLEGVVLKIGADTLEGAGQQKTFAWTGAAETIQVNSKTGDTLDSFPSSPWAVFKFISRARRLGSDNLEWIQESNGRPIILSNGLQKSYDYQLRVSGANPFFELQTMRCVSRVTR